MSKDPMWRGLPPNRALKIFNEYGGISTDKFKAEKYDVGMVVKALYCVHAQWENLGELISIPQATLDRLKRRWRKNAVMGLIHVVDHWMKGKYEEKKLHPCWWSVVYVVADSIGGDNPAAARKIAKNWKKYQDKSLSDLAMKGNDADLTLLAGRGIVNNLLSALKDVYYKWFEIGVLLGVPVSKLEDFEGEMDSRLRFKAIINEWLKMVESDTSFPTPTMRVLIDAVEDDVGGANSNLARKLTESNPDDTPSQEATPPPPPDATSSPTAESTPLDEDDPSRKPYSPPPTENGVRNEDGIERIEDDNHLQFGYLLSDIIPSERWKMKDVHNCKPFSLQGKGTVIAIIDSGVCTKYDLLSSKKIEGFGDDWDVPLGAKNSVPAECEHGTLTASIIGGKYKDGKSYGIAPEADLYVCKVMNNKAKLKENDLLAALRHILEIKTNKTRNIDIVNMSLGFERKNKEIEQVLEELTKQGVVLIAAAGNDGNFQRTPHFPASDSHVLAVGALDQKGNPASSNPPQGIDVYLPGRDIAFPNVESHSGSSCAAPMLAGLISLLIQWAKDKNGSETVLAKYHDVNFLKVLLQNPLLSDEGGKILRTSDFLCDIIGREESHVVKLITDIYSDFEDKK